MSDRRTSTELRTALDDVPADLRNHTWTVWTSCSFRRISCHGDGDVVCAITLPSDGHPDLHAKPGVLDYIAAASPKIVGGLLITIDELEREVIADRQALRDAKTTIENLVGEIAKLRDEAHDRGVEKDLAT